MVKQKMTQYSVVVKNEPGALHRITDILGRENISITGINAQSAGEVSFVRFLSDRESRLVRKPLEQAGYEVFESPCFQFELLNRPGEFSRLTKYLAEEDINILNAYGTTDGDETGKVVVVVDRPERAHSVLSKSSSPQKVAA